MINLSILIPALRSRNHSPLVDELLKQADVAASAGLGHAEILIEEDNGESTSGVKRQKLVNRSRGQYICFVDDDDWIKDDYIISILEAAKTEQDVITFDLEIKRSDTPWMRETWSYRLCEDQRHKGLMAANHLCAWKRELATLVGWCPYLGYGDDQLWYKPLMLSGRVKSEHHICKRLYEYRFCPMGTVNQQRYRILAGRNYALNGLECYWAPVGTIVVAKGFTEGEGARIPEMATVIDHIGQVVTIRPQYLTPIGTVGIV